MMSIYPIVRVQLSFAQFSLLCYEFCILSKTECKSVYYHFRRDHEFSSFEKVARNKWICRETCDFFHDQDFNILCYNEIRDFTANQLSEVCHDVQLEPWLKPLTGELYY